MQTRFLGLAAAALGAALSAQSPLTTTYAGGNGLGGNTMMWFDLTVNTTVTITQIDVNAGGGSTAGGIDFYTIAGGHAGNETNSSAWTLQGSVAVAAPSPAGTPTPCVFNAPFTLAPGTYGVAIGYTGGLGQTYTNGPLGPYSTVEMTLTQGGSGGIWGGIVNTPRVFNGSLYYTTGAGFASSTPYGHGCPARSSVAVYELFSTALTFDLANSSLLFIPSGTGAYTVLPGPNLWFSGFTNNLALGDDQCATVTLPFPFPHAGGSTTTISPCSNGFVWLGGNSNADYTPTVAEFLSDPMARIAACWMDLYPVTTGGVFADFDTATGEYVVTWNAVPEFSTLPPVTMQVALQASGIFEIRYQALTNTTHLPLVGYSMGGNAADPGSSDLSSVVTTPITTASAANPLMLGSSARPVLGTSINLVTSNIAGGTVLGANLLGFGQFNPGIDLTAFGAPGCEQYVSPAYTGVFLVSGPTSAMALNVPNNAALAGLHVYGQSLAFSGGYNALGLVFSNGLDLKLDLQ